MNMKFAENGECLVDAVGKGEEVVTCGSGEFATCANTLNECPVTNIRMFESDQLCSGIATEGDETCLEVTETTRLVFSKNSNKMPLTRFLVEEKQPCADQRLISSIENDMNPGCVETSYGFFDERYTEIAAEVTGFNLGKVEEESGVAELLDSSEAEKNEKSAIPLRFFTREPSALISDDEELLERFKSFMLSEDADAPIYHVSDAMPSIRRALVTALVFFFIGAPWCGPTG